VNFVYVEFEQRSEKENGNDNDNNKFPELAIVQRSNHERIKRGMFVKIYIMFVTKYVLSSIKFES
jgi:hypothetical protein